MVGRRFLRLAGWVTVGMSAGRVLGHFIGGKDRPVRRIRWTPPSGQRRDDAALAARTSGDGLPATVLIHGTFASGRYWGGHYDGLGAGHLLVVPDLAGFGRSLDIGEGYGPDEHADLVAQSLRQLGAGDERSVIAAHSLGCLVALRVAARHPELVSGIVAFSPPLYRSRQDAVELLARAGLLLRLFVLRPRRAEAFCIWMGEHPALILRLARLARPDLPAPLAEDRLKHTYRSYSESVSKVIVAAGAAAWLAEVDVPVRLVAGDQDRIVDRDFLAELANGHDNVELSLWPKTGHEVPLTHPEDCLRAIEQMRQRVVPGIGAHG